MLNNRITNLPGTANQDEIIEQIIRVDQAGEYGAKKIYQGQLAILGKSDCADTLRHMAEQEQEHLNYFNQQIINRQSRPSLLMPIWHITGFALGAATALMGKKAAMACTVAIEETIDEHYKEQIIKLNQFQDQYSHDLKNHIEKFRQEEIEHRNIGLEHGAKEAKAYGTLYSLIKFAAKTAIIIAKKI